MDNTHHLLQSIKTLQKWRNYIGGFVLLCSLSAVVTTFLMPNYYKSKAVFYPTNPSNTDRQTLFNKQGGEAIIDYFGSKNDVNRLLAIGNSSSVTDYIINLYKYWEIYDIDTQRIDWRYRVYKKFMKNYSILKTELGAIEVTFSDTDRDRAALIVNEIVAKIDYENKQVIQKNKQDILKIFQDNLSKKQIEVVKLTDTLSSLRSSYDIKEMAVGEKGTTYVGNDPRGIEVYRYFATLYDGALEELNNLYSLKDQYAASSVGDFSTVFIIERAYASPVKDRPVRSLICVAVFFSSVILGVFGALLFEGASQLRVALQKME